MDSHRLALGTVQFGLPYGVANTRGQVPLAVAGEILARARAAGIDTLDTAVAYGESETVLGRLGVRAWNIISKLPPVPAGCDDVRGWATAIVRSSLQRLQTDRLRGLLLHAPEQLLRPGGRSIYDSLLLLKELGLVEKIGVSVYAPSELDVLADYELDVVQLPLNVLDRRFVNSGALARLAAVGIEVHVRSVFMQGLLLMNRTQRPGYFSRWNTLWLHWEEWLAREHLTALNACLTFALSQPGIARVLVGVDSLDQLEEILAATHALVDRAPPDLVADDPDLVDPSRWRVA